MRRVILESPFAGNVIGRWVNRRYARKCLKHSLDKGEAPLASHLLYPQALNDSNEDDRRKGIAAGLSWVHHAEATVVYVDRGITQGMMAGIDAAEAQGVPVEYRALDPKHQLPGRL